MSASESGAVVSQTSAEVESDPLLSSQALAVGARRPIQNYRIISGQCRHNWTHLRGCRPRANRSVSPADKG